VGILKTFFDTLRAPSQGQKPTPKPLRQAKGQAERVSVFVADEYYMGITLLLKGETTVCRLKIHMYDTTLPYELTQVDDMLTFSVDEAGRIDADSFRNFTLEARLKKAS
jgi:hypothetical protein